MISMAVTAMAQGTVSPYSKFGYGLLGESATNMQRSMGEVGYAMQGGRQVNTMNPAAYAFTDSLTFLWDMGVDLTLLRAYDAQSETSGKATGGGLDYIAMQFPLSKTMGMSIGVVPMSSVGYAFGKTLEHGTDSRTGDGGITRFYAGVAWSPIKFISIGANVGYEFGSIVHDTYVLNEAGSTTMFERVMQVRNWGAQIGIQANANIGRRHRMNFGLMFSPGRSLHGQTWCAYYDYTLDTKQDSIGYTKLNDKYSMPATYGAGIGYCYDNRFYLEFDYTFQPWSKAKYAPLKGFDPDNIMMAFKDRQKFALGMEYVPSLRGNFAQRISYRLGGNYTSDYMSFDGDNLREYSVSCGFGIPTAANSKTIINIGFEYKRRTTPSKALVTENYYNFTLGVTFNEAWFFQSKIR